MLALVKSIGLSGIHGYAMQIEVDCRDSGMPTFELVGLPDASVKESRERIRSALKNSGLQFPYGQITVNLAPAEKKKEGPRYDLPIALGLLAASGQIPGDALKTMAAIGELSLDGGLQPVTGLLPMLSAAREMGIGRALIPKGNAQEAACLQGIKVYTAGNILDVVRFFRGEGALDEVPFEPYSAAPGAGGITDMAQVKGQFAAKRAMEIAASGGHNILLIGAPGSGKTMLARCLPGILPSMRFEEALQSSVVHSVSGQIEGGLLKSRPFRAPHHTASVVSLIGGGRNAMPGEISKAHNGVLFLDEFPEFPRPVLEALRQPMEDGEVFVTRIGGQYAYPARFMLVCAMNPCPCGNFGSQTKRCRCTPQSISRYLGRVSGPLLDRIDLIVQMDDVPVEEVFEAKAGESSEQIRIRVEKTRAIAASRYAQAGVFSNAQLGAAQIEEFCALDAEGLAFMKAAMQQMQLSMRAYTRVLKLGRTLADMEGLPQIQVKHLAEALSYRGTNDKFWK